MLTGITEVTFTLFAGLIWRPLAADFRRAAGIGLGAGALEAILVGIAAIVGQIVMAEQGTAMPPMTAAMIFAPVVERLMTIPCHTAMRAMALYAVVTNRWSWFWGSFILASLIDAIAGYYLMSGPTDMNPWLIELSFVAFPIICIPILRHLSRHWPSAKSLIGVTADAGETAWTA